MKKAIACIAFTLVTFLISCENEEEISASEVPQAVISAFQSRYPNIIVEKWMKENEDNKIVYEAKFKANNKEIEAEFDESGDFIEEE